MAGGARDEGFGVDEGGRETAFRSNMAFPAHPQHLTPRGREMIGSECLGKHRLLHR